MKNKKGMIGSLIGGFIVLIIGFTILPTIQQEVNNAINCNQTINNTKLPIGSTDSFGGGGSGHFGGYDGEVKTNWASKYSLYKTNESIILNPDCKPISGASQTMVGLVSLFFVLAIVITSFTIIVPALNDAGLFNI